MPTDPFFGEEKPINPDLGNPGLPRRGRIWRNWIDLQEADQ